MKEQISNCCKAPVNVNSADEGTSCFMCTKCNKPCDLFCEAKEIEELQRLKRLEENVKNKIELIKSTIEKVKDDGLGEFYIDKAILMALEGLYK